MKNFRSSIKLIILSSVLIYAAGCKDGVYTPAEIETEVSFQQDLIPIFNRSCVSCHEAADSPPPILVPESAYSNIMSGGYIIPGNAEESLFYKRLIGDPEIRGGRTMPPAEKLPASEIQMIKAWIEQGSQNN